LEDFHIHRPSPRDGVNTPDAAFDDRSLPVSNLSAQRIEEIEKILMPGFLEQLEKLKQEKPHLFKSHSKK
jgi:hypothetical protein